MEVFTGDRCMPTGVVLFPDNLTHFPSTHFDDHSPSGLFTQPPPQKLRPIRCNGRNSVDFSDPASGGLQLISCYGPPLEELGFFTQPTEKQNEEGKEGGDYQPGVSVENTCSLVGVECNKLLAQAHKFEEISSSGEEIPEAKGKSSKRKRKRRKREKLKSFVENMIMSVMQKQEQFQRQMIEILEKKEKDHLTREEAWKQQEMERAKKEHEVRAQETSRNLALISYIQNLMGHEINIPAPLEIPSQKKEGKDILNQEDITCDPNNNQEKLEVLKYGPGNNQEDLDCDPNNRRWPKSEVQALITVRTALTQKVNSKGQKNFICWEEVAMGMSNLGYIRTPKKCKEKWDNINKYYKRLIENGSTKRSDKSKVCQYFNELDMLYKSGLIGSGTPDSCSKNVIEEQSIAEEKSVVKE